jgi:hypothetical protein
MSESAGSTYFSEAGLQTDPTSVPVIRGVVFTPNGVTLTLSASGASSNVLPLQTPALAAVGYLTGAVNLVDGADSFTMFLSGHKANDRF